jgi:epoxyqueuosine reductase QueG
MEKTTALVRYFKNNNISVYGINSSKLMDNAPQGFQPSDYLPGAKSIICFALPVPESVYSLSAYRTDFVWRTQNLLYRQLDTHSLMIANYLENHGHKAIPIYGCLPQRYNAKKEIAGYLNQIAMGSITGIGFIGKNGLLINSVYGSRMMLGAVITNAEFPALCEPQNTMTDCPPDCDICYTLCPVKAILPEARRVKIMKCLAYTAIASNLPKLKFLLLRIFNPAKSIRLLNLMGFDEHTYHICSLCVAECPYGRKKTR